MEIYRGNALSFIEELVDKYRETFGSSAKSARPDDAPHRPGHIFVSYRHEDEAAARELVELLENNHLEVWYDKVKLGPGDTFDIDIRDAIQKESCAFIPLIATGLLEEVDSYFYQEWRWADEARQRKPNDVRFIFPVIMSDEENANAFDKSWFMSRLVKRFNAFEDLHVVQLPQENADRRKQPFVHNADQVKKMSRYVSRLSRPSAVNRVPNSLTTNLSILKGGSTIYLQRVTTGKSTPGTRTGSWNYRRRNSIS